MEDANMTLFLILQGVSTICFFFGVFIINGFKGSLEKMQESIGNLNLNLARLLEKDINKDQRLEEHRTLILKAEKEIDTLRDRYHNIINNMARIDLIAIEVEDLKKQK